MSTTFNNNDIYTDFSQLNNLRTQAQHNQQGALMQVAKQFEAIFTQFMLKSMRDASNAMGDDIFSNDATELYQNMQDSQLALNISQKGGLGLANIIAQQLQPKKPKSYKMAMQQAIPAMMMTPKQSTTALSSTQALVNTTESVSVKNEISSTIQKFNSPEEFIRYLWDKASTVANSLGVDTKVLIAQAALETGWGSHMAQDKSGAFSYNLFGIKADASWNNKSIKVPTLENHNGIMVKEYAAFRSYNSFLESLKDYANFLRNNPRYQAALNKAANPSEFIAALQKAGYATDPSYAEKINNILQNSVLKDWPNNNK